MRNNKIGNGDQEAAKARVQEVREQMTIDKIGEKVKGGINPENMMLGEFSITPPDIDPSFKRLNLNATVSPFSKGVEEGRELKQKLDEIDETRQELDKITADNLSLEIKTGENMAMKTYSLGKTPEELRKLFDFCESGSKVELLIVLNILNNPKTTPEDLDYYFFEVQEGSDAEFLVARALIAHPNLTQELFDKNYGMAMQKGGPVFDLFEIADGERSKKAKEDKEKMNDTMQGTIFTLFNKQGSGMIRGDNGRDYIFDFTHIIDKSGDEDKADIYDRLSKNSKVEFKIIPKNKLSNNPDKIKELSKLSKEPGTGLDQNFMAIDIVVKD